MEWIEVAKTFGLPVALLMILLFGLGRTAKWIATEIVKPAFDRHMKHLDKVEANLEASQKVMEQMGASLQAMAERLDQHLPLHAAA